MRVHLSFIDEVENNKPITISNTESLPDNVLKIVPWLKYTEISNAQILLKTDRIEWLKGTFISGEWLGGIFKNGKWLDGTWKSGTFNNGLWYNGLFEDGEFSEKAFWESGTFKGGLFKGTWETGFFDGGVFEGSLWLGGTWNDGDWKSGTWKSGKIYSKKFNKLFESLVNPIEFKKVEDESGSEINLISTLEDN